MNIHWDILLHELESEKCVLCVGPDVFSKADGYRIEEKFAETLRANSAALGIRVYEDGWFHYLNERDELATWFSIKKFYETQLPADSDAVFKAIARLPFHLVLNFSPDYRMRDAYSAIGKNFTFDTLNKTENCHHPDKEPTADNPLIFNMLGEIKEKESLVMTFDDLHGYIEAVFEKKRFPKNVKDKIEQASHFIFLGMPLDKWYFHLFMRMLNMHRDTSKTKRFAATFSYDESNMAFCREQYNINFVETDISTFAHTLDEKWTTAQAQKNGDNGQSTFDRWRAAGQSGEDKQIRAALTEMKTSVESNNDLSNNLILIEMQWNGFQSTIFETEMSKNAMKSQIVKGILFLIDQIETLIPNK